MNSSRNLSKRYSRSAAAAHAKTTGEPRTRGRGGPGSSAAARAARLVRPAGLPYRSAPIGSAGGVRRIGQVHGSACLRPGGRARRLHRRGEPDRPVAVGGDQDHRPARGRAGRAALQPLDAAPADHRFRPGILPALRPHPGRPRGCRGRHQARQRRAARQHSRRRAAVFRARDPGARTARLLRALSGDQPRAALQRQCGGPDRAGLRAGGPHRQHDQFPSHHAAADPRTAGHGGGARAI